MTRADDLNVGDVVDYRGFPATVQNVSVGRTVDVVIDWQEAGSSHQCRITYPILTGGEWNAEWTEEDFAARRESDLQAEQFTVL
jgi:hypothetical protein